MLQNIKQLYGYKLGASDGEIGHVKDFYFDDQTWVIRYLVADTGSWLPGRLVLLSPHAFGKLDPAKKVLPIGLSRKQIENSPPIESHLPISRQYEEQYYSYYGWPVYWQGGGLWGGMGAFPVAMPVPISPPPPPARQRHEDRHLQSTRLVAGSHIQTVDGSIGHVSGMMADDRSWEIRDLVVETGHWYSGKEIMITTSKVERVSYEEAKVFVSLTKDDILRTQKDHVAHAETRK